MPSSSKEQGIWPVPIDPKQKVVKLTHFGRKSGKPYVVPVWFILDQDQIWIGSMDSDRNWVKNLLHHNKAEVDFGGGPWPVRVKSSDASETLLFRDRITKKHPIMSRLLRLFFDRGQLAFRLIYTP